MYHDDNDDDVIIGVRCTGTALARMLARGGLKVLVSECATVPGETKSGDGLVGVASPANDSLAFVGIARR